MRIVISHLTRMRDGFCCVAGIHEESGTHVRPVLINEQLPVGVLASRGGPFDMAVRLDIGRVTPLRRCPHIEDCVFQLDAVREVNRPCGDVFWDVLASSARSDLEEAFGPALARSANGICSTAEGMGDASLACIRPTSVPVLSVRSRPGRSPQIRVLFRDNTGLCDASLTDIRLFKDDHVTPDLDKVNRLPEIMEQSAELILSVGLTREYNGAHWVQVNNIHIREYPLWRLGR